MDEALQASKGERTAGRLGYRAGYYNRMLVTRVGHIELRVPQHRQGRFRTEVFQRARMRRLSLPHPFFCIVSGSSVLNHSHLKRHGAKFTWQVEPNLGNSSTLLSALKAITGSLILLEDPNGSTIRPKH